MTSKERAEAFMELVYTRKFETFCSDEPGGSVSVLTEFFDQQADEFVEEMERLTGDYDAASLLKGAVNRRGEE